MCQALLTASILEGLVEIGWFPGRGHPIRTTSLKDSKLAHVAIAPNCMRLAACFVLPCRCPLGGGTGRGAPVVRPPLSSTAPAPTGSRRRLASPPADTHPKGGGWSMAESSRLVLEIHPVPPGVDNRGMPRLIAWAGGDAGRAEGATVGAGPRGPAARPSPDTAT